MRETSCKSRRSYITYPVFRAFTIFVSKSRYNDTRLDIQPDRHGLEGNTVIRRGKRKLPDAFLARTRDARIWQGEITHICDPYLAVTSRPHASETHNCTRIFIPRVSLNLRQDRATTWLAGAKPAGSCEGVYIPDIVKARRYICVADWIGRFPLGRPRSFDNFVFLSSPPSRLVLAVFSFYLRFLSLFLGPSRFLAPSSLEFLSISSNCHLEKSNMQYWSINEI